MNKLGLSGILYIVGFIGAIIVGLLEGLNVMPEIMWVPIVLVVAGLLIGLLNIAKGEVTAVMVSALVLGIGGGILSILPGIGIVLEAVLSRIAFLSVPVAIPVAVTTLAAKLE